MPGSRAARKTAALGRLVGAVGIAGVLTAGLMLPAVGGLGLAARNSVDAFDREPCDVNPVPPPQKSVLLAADGKTQIASFFRYNREVVPLSQIPQVMQKALVAIEDRRFYEHHGVDGQSIARAVIQNGQAGAVVQGGSTLTMQYVKLFRQYSATTKAEQDAAIAQNTNRKLVDARCALTLEKKLNKSQILERYLNIAYYGAGVYGVATAAKQYFNIPVSKLSLPQAAMLAGIVQSPSRYDPYQDRKLTKFRRDTVLDEMQSVGYITPKQASLAKATPIRIVPRRPTSQQDCANANRALTNVGFFCDYAKSYLATIGIPQQRLDSGGLRVVTTLNPEVQRSVQAGVAGQMPADRVATSVMDVVDHRTGNVLAMAASKLYGNQKDTTHTSIALGTRPIAGAGSTYKLFVLIAALQRKVPLRNFTITFPDKTYQPAVCQARISDRKIVQNAGNYPNQANLEFATYASMNTFFVALLDQQFGDCDLSGPVQLAERMGLNALKSPREGHKTPQDQETIDGQQYSFTLGPNGTSPLELASAYGTVANDGKYCPPSPVLAVIGPDGKKMGLPEHTCTQVIDPAIAHTVSQVLVKDTAPGFAGTANKRFASYYGQGGSPIAGKTGTASSQDNLNSSAWFVGYTPEFVASVATLNYQTPQATLNDVPGFEANGGEIFGAYSAGIWRDALGPILLKRPAWKFPPEDPAVVNGNSVPVPSVVGQTVPTAQTILGGAGFQVQVSPDRKPGPYGPDQIAVQSPTDRAMAGQTITVYLSTGQPQPGQPQPGQPLPGQPTIAPGGGIIPTIPGGAPRPPWRRPKPPRHR